MRVATEDEPPPGTGSTYRVSASGGDPLLVLSDTGDIAVQAAWDAPAPIAGLIRLQGIVHYPAAGTPRVVIQTGPHPQFGPTYVSLASGPFLNDACR